MPRSRNSTWSDHDRRRLAAALLHRLERFSERHSNFSEGYDEADVEMFSEGKRKGNEAFAVGTNGLISGSERRAMRKTCYDETADADDDKLDRLSMDVDEPDDDEREALAREWHKLHVGKDED